MGRDNILKNHFLHPPLFHLNGASGFWLSTGFSQNVFFQLSSLVNCATIKQSSPLNADTKPSSIMISSSTYSPQSLYRTIVLHANELYYLSDVAILKKSCCYLCLRYNCWCWVTMALSYHHSNYQLHACLREKKVKLVENQCSVL